MSVSGTVFCCFSLFFCLSLLVVSMRKKRGGRENTSCRNQEWRKSGILKAKMRIVEYFLGASSLMAFFSFLSFFSLHSDAKLMVLFPFDVPINFCRTHIYNSSITAIYRGLKTGMYSDTLTFGIRLPIWYVRQTETWNLAGYYTGRPASRAIYTRQPFRTCVSSFYFLSDERKWEKSDEKWAHEPYLNKLTQWRKT